MCGLHFHYSQDTACLFIFLLGHFTEQKIKKLLLSVLGIEPKALHVLGSCSTTMPSALFYFYFETGSHKVTLELRWP
jgi:hypothetical protein